MRKLIGSFLWGAILVLPLQIRADDHDRARNDNRSQRYYDSSLNDYHRWNDEEQREYDRYLTEHRRKREDFDRMNKREQRDYWKWRHEHGENR